MEKMKIRAALFLLVSCILLAGCAEAQKPYLTGAPLAQIESDLLESIVFTIDEQYEYESYASMRNGSDYDLYDITVFEAQTQQSILWMDYLPAQTAAEGLYCGLTDLPPNAGNEMYAEFSIGEYRYTTPAAEIRRQSKAEVPVPVDLTISVKTAGGLRRLVPGEVLRFDAGDEIEGLTDPIDSMEAVYEPGYDTGTVNVEIRLTGQKNSYGSGHEVAKLFGTDGVIYDTWHVWMNEGGEVTLHFYSLMSGEYTLVIDE